VLQIKKTYRDLKPKLLYDELKDFIIKQGVVLGESRMQTYATPQDTSSFIMRGTLSFTAATKDKPVIARAHIVGSQKGETKLMVDIDETVFLQEKISALEDDLGFVFGAYEVNQT
jgi:hypothetical protein